MSHPLERQIQGFQFKIQEAIAIKDEEIDSLSETLVLMKSKIIEIKEEMQSIDQEIETIHSSRESAKRCNQAEYERLVSLKRAQHQELIQQIQASHLNEIDELQNQFSQTLQNAQKKSDLAYVDQFRQIERQKETTLALIDNYRSTIKQIKSTNEELNSELIEDSQIQTEHFQKNEQRIELLQQVIKQRNNERLRYLQESTEKLKECLKIIEKMDQDHIKQSNELRKSIEVIDQAYNEEVDSIKEKHRVECIVQKEMIKRATKNYQTLKTALTKLKNGHGELLKESQFQMQKVKERYAHSAPASPFFNNSNSLKIFQNNISYNSMRSTPIKNPQPYISSETDDDSDEKESMEENRSRLRESKSLIRKKELDLDQIRKDNLILKQELGKLKHFVKYAPIVEI